MVYLPIIIYPIIFAQRIKKLYARIQQSEKKSDSS